MFDCTTFIRRMGWAQKDLAERLEIGTSTVGMWCTGKSSPTYEAIEKLLKLGVTPKELFGEEVDGIIRQYYTVGRFEDAEFREGVSLASDPGFNAEVQKVVLAMKASGKI